MATKTNVPDGSTFQNKPTEIPTETFDSSVSILSRMQDKLYRDE